MNYKRNIITCKNSKLIIETDKNYNLLRKINCINKKLLLFQYIIHNYCNLNLQNLICKKEINSSINFSIIIIIFCDDRDVSFIKNAHKYSVIL